MLNIKGYEWAVNRPKLERAIKWAKVNGSEGNEEIIRKRYIELGGFISLKHLIPKVPEIAETSPVLPSLEEEKKVEGKPTRRKK